MQLIPPLLLVATFATLLSLPACSRNAVASEPKENDGAASKVTIDLVADGRPQAFDVRGLSPSELNRLRAMTGRPDDWRDLFIVGASPDGDATVQPMLGRYSLTAGCPRFEPRFPLVTGVAYTAIFRLDRLGGRDHEVRRTFEIPDQPGAEPTSLRRVFPTADLLPENLLKLYLHFDAPMSRGEAYRRVHLLDENRKPVDLPFVELDEELWNDAGTRLTLLFDPGRIKRGVKPREDAGPVLVEGRRFTLSIDRDWRDAAGRPLKAGFEKTFRVGPPDDRQPDPARWKIAPPSAGGRTPLVVEFGEPLDSAMLEHVLIVRDSTGAAIAGEIVVERGESRWSFRPAEAWQAGAYALVVESTLEDLAGNSIGRPFEVLLDGPPRQRPAASAVSLPFRITLPGSPAR